METYADLIECEDVLLFANAAITSTGQREFHSAAGEQRLSLAFLHDYIHGNYPDLYAATLALDINDHNAALIIANLLKRGAGLPGAGDARLIAWRLARMSPPRVYRLFQELRRAGVNNRRTRAIIRDWLAARPDLAFDAVKYRSALKSAVRHAHLRPEGELGDFLFAPFRRARYEAPLLEAWRRAHYDKNALYELPYTVAEGFAARHGISRAVFLERVAPRLTKLERLRLTGAAERDGVRTEADLAAMPLVRLASYVLSLAPDVRARRRAELVAALRAAAARAAGARAGTWGDVAAVLDDSFSSFGSPVKRRRPLAVALACHYLLRALAGSYRGLWLSGRSDPLQARPTGPTPLGRRIIDALEGRPSLLVIVSDGWDNAPPGLAGEVLRVWRRKLDPAGEVGIVHLNPVYDAEQIEVRRLATVVPTAGIRDAEDLPALVELARFAEGRTGLAELRAYLEDRAARR
ncbi:unnamed protein product [[Actinomadura] parvosata subsp. kistnae]|uniref:VWA domain-containing protein n=1 Tax=[Actinomadura] parvosata subsp. kistnae TaxID=1909395 RepID=A0A1V0A8J5_9ACTN|nr:hypothetical protein [Nonomuraea sp. ATCC 55076]AQZ66528.1 hypothetical protein BKM31_38300 [Nonomuraea sp. ATCC 55076]SPL95403.1 unnamed protein product [Actinomadura parvosata subsp. kistnae]